MTYSAEVLADSPLGYWRLDDASGTTMADSSGRGHHGTYQGTPLLARPTMLASGDGHAVGFTGDDAGDVPYAAWMNVSQWSVEAIFTPYSGSGTRTIACRHQDVAGSTWILRLDGNSLVAYALDSSGFRSATYSTPIVAGQTYHAVMTSDGTTLRLYVNGGLATSTSTGAITTANTADLRIGASGASGFSGGEFFNGDIDEVAFYGSVLSATRIAVHYAAITSTAPPSNPLTLDSFTSAGSLDVTLHGHVTHLAIPTLTGVGSLTVTLRGHIAPLTVDPFTSTSAMHLSLESGSGDFTHDVPYTLAGTTGSFSVDFAASNPAWISYTPATDGALVIQAISPDGWEAAWTIYDTDGDEIDDDTGNLGLVWVADEPALLSIAPNTGFPATLVTFTWSYAARASSVLTLSLDYDYVHVTPAGLLVSISNGQPGEVVTFSLTGPTDVPDFQTSTLDEYGTAEDVTVELPSLQSGAYLLRVEGAGSGSEDVEITIEEDALSYDDDAPKALDTPPSVAPINRWRFYDLRDQEVTWTFEKNPDSWSNIFPPTDFTHSKTTAPDGQPLTWQAASRPWRMQFNGTITSEAEYEQLVFWSQLRRRFWLIDHRNRAWLVTIEQFDAQAQVKPGYPWLHKYTVSTLIFTQGTTG